MKILNRSSLLAVFAFLCLTSALPAATISITGPSNVTGSSFDVVVAAQNVFAGRNATDLLISYGFNVNVADPTIFAFTSATSGPLFDPATTEPGTTVFGSAEGQNGFGVEPGVTEPLILATLHFQVLKSGSSNLTITSDLTNLFEGLQYLNSPLQESIAGSLSVKTTLAAVPEPATWLLLSAAGLVTAGSLHRKRTL